MKEIFASLKHFEGSAASMLPGDTMKYIFTLAGVLLGC